MSSPFDHLRTHELCLGRALNDLSPEELRELEQLNGTTEQDIDEFDIAVSAMHLAFLGEVDEPLPNELRARIEQSASQTLGRPD